MHKHNKHQSISILKKFRETLRDFSFFHQNGIIDGFYFAAEFRLNEKLETLQNFITTLERDKPLTNDHFLLLHDFSSLARTHNILVNELNNFVCDSPYRPIGEDELSAIENFRRDCEDVRARPKRCSYTAKQFADSLKRLERGERLSTICAAISPKTPKSFEVSLRHWYQSQYGKPFSAKRLQGKA